MPTPAYIKSNVVAILSPVKVENELIKIRTPQIAAEKPKGLFTLGDLTGHLLITPEIPETAKMPRTRKKPTKIDEFFAAG